MTPLVAFPVRSFEHAKQRLSKALDPASRRRLARGLAHRAIHTVRDAGVEPVVVSSAPDVVEDAGAWSVEVLAEPPEGGLNAAAAVATARAGDAPWLILHSDLPLLSVEDLGLLFTALGEGPVLAPSYDGGTTALGGRSSFPFAYGTASFHRHLRAAPHARVVSATGLLLDIDDGRDLDAARQHPRGAWLDDLLQ